MSLKHWKARSEARANIKDALLWVSAFILAPWTVVPGVFHSSCKLATGINFKSTASICVIIITLSLWQHQMAWLAVGISSFCFESTGVAVNK